MAAGHLSQTKPDKRSCEKQAGRRARLGSPAGSNGVDGQLACWRELHDPVSGSDRDVQGPIAYHVLERLLALVRIAIGMDGDANLPAITHRLHTEVPEAERTGFFLRRSHTAREAHVELLERGNKERTATRVRGCRRKDLGENSK